MFRKRKTPAPYFRLPNPANPISGDAEYLYAPLKQFVRFTLDEELGTGDENKLASITDQCQWGPNPIYHCSAIKIHVHNQLGSDDGVYIFKGKEGDAGLAAWDQNNHWRIIWMAPEPGGGNSVATTEVIIPKRVGNIAGGPVSVMKKKLVVVPGENEEDEPTNEFMDDGSVDVFSWISSDSSDPAGEINDDPELDGILWIFIEEDNAGIWWFTGQDCPLGMS